MDRILLIKLHDLQLSCIHCFSSVQFDIEKVDLRGRTPLHLAVTLGRTKCVKLFLDHGADVMATNRHQWTGTYAKGAVWGP